MRPGRRLAIVAAAGLFVTSSVLAGAAFGEGRSAPRMVVFAAASLTDVFPQIDRHEAYDFGGSNALATEIQQGAPADVFASANTKLPNALYAKGLVTKPVDFTLNRLVLVVAKGNPLDIRGPRALERKGVTFVMAAAGVPVGDYTRTCLAKLGLSSLVDKAASQDTDVREVLAQVVNGSADAGFVYATDAKTVSGQVAVVSLPAKAQPRVTYAAAAVKASSNLKAAKAWVKRLLGKPAQRKLRAAGFLRLPR